MSFFACKSQKSAENVSNLPPKEEVQAPSPSEFKVDIDATEAKSLLEKNNTIVLLDVRTPQEIAQGKIGDAKEIDFSAPDFKEKVAKLDKTKEYIVYCAAGGRSARAVSLMNEMGFTKAHNLTSGYSGWKSGQ
jgi:rhodanese-related sulfurtransferase